MAYHYIKEFFAETKEQAVAKAAEHYGVDAGALEVSEASLEQEVDGMGDRHCFLIKVTGGADEPNVPAGGGRRDDRRGRSDRRDGRDRDRGRGGRDRDRDRDRRRGGRSDRGRGDRRPKGDKPEGVDHERLEAMAKDAADRALDTGEVQVLDPMNSKERWVVHNFLKDVEGVTSESEGEGREKHVKVIPD